MVNIHELNEDESPKCIDSCGGDHGRARRMLLLDKNHEEGLGFCFKGCFKSARKR